MCSCVPSKLIFEVVVLAAGRDVADHEVAIDDGGAGDGAVRQTGHGSQHHIIAVVPPT